MAWVDPPRLKFLFRLSKSIDGDDHIDLLAACIDKPLLCRIKLRNKASMMKMYRKRPEEVKRNGSREGGNKEEDGRRATL